MYRILIYSVHLYIILDHSFSYKVNFEEELWVQPVPAMKNKLQITLPSIHQKSQSWVNTTKQTQNLRIVLLYTQN